MVVRGGHILGFQVFGHPVNNVGVLGVDHGCDPESPGGMHDVQDLVISQLKGFVCHVYLDTGDAILVHHHGKVHLKDMFCRIGQDHVETIVAVRLTVCELRILFQHRHQTLIVAKLACESNDRGRASSDGTACPGIVSVVRVIRQVWDLSVCDLCPHEAIHRRLVQLTEMDMRVDTAGCDICSLSIEDFCTVMRGKKTMSNGQYFPILDVQASFSIEILSPRAGALPSYLDADVAFVPNIRGCDHVAVADNEIEVHSSSKAVMQSNVAVERHTPCKNPKTRVFTRVRQKPINFIPPFCQRQPRRIERTKSSRIFRSKTGILIRKTGSIKEWPDSQWPLNIPSR